MATKGRLTMSGRREYEVYSVGSPVVPGVRGYYAMCECAMGRHYLGYDAAGNLIECTAQNGQIPYRYDTYADAQAAIAAWQRQHDEQRRDSAESEA